MANDNFKNSIDEFESIKELPEGEEVKELPQYDDEQEIAGELPAADE